MQRLSYWFKGIRVYVALGSLLLTVLVTWWAAVAYGGSPLFASRLEEVFAWLATGLIVLAIAIGPIYKLFSRLPGRVLFRDARRMIGISAAWFATLHVGIAYGSQFHWSNPLRLPALYQRSFLLGIVALVILLAMTATSFDAAFRRLGIWWFRLHRLVYAVVLLVLLHAFMTGVHATQLIVLLAMSVLAVSLLIVYGLIFSKPASRRTPLQLLTIMTMAVLLLAVIGFGFAQHASQARTMTYGARP